jgi:hypothetical protein
MATRTEAAFVQSYSLTPRLFTPDRRAAQVRTGSLRSRRYLRDAEHYTHVLPDARAEVARKIEEVII